MTASTVPETFVGRLARQDGVTGTKNPFDEDARWEPVRLADAGEPPDGSIVEVQPRGRGDVPAARVLALADSALAAVYGIAIDHRLNPTFRAEVDREVQQLLAAPGLDNPTLTDLTHLAFVTVDDEHTRDLDQALFIERHRGELVLWYALADASFYVRPGTALFAEALRRGSSYYLPGLVVPMLPRALSEGLISLNEGQLRRAFVFRIPIDEGGAPTGTTLQRGTIRSRAKLSFDRVQTFLADPTAHPISDPAVGESLQLLRQFGEIRLHHAEQRHVVHYRRSEVAVDLADHEGLRFVAEAEPRGPVEQYNEQLSLLCNVEGARLLARGDEPDDGVEPIYRVHPRPDEQRLVEFEALTVALAAAHQLDTRVWAWRRNAAQSLAEYLAALPQGGQPGRVARAIHRQAVLLNLRSSFAEHASEHYGIGAEVYARFSSPMREVVGVFVHKEAWERTGGGAASAATAAEEHRGAAIADDELRRQIIDSANRAKDLQKRVTREANRLVIDQWFGDDLHEPLGRRRWHHATVLGLTRSRAHVLLDSPPLEVKVYVRDLERQLDAQVSLDDDGVALRRSDSKEGLCRIGDAVRIRARGRDERRDRWVLELVAPR